MNGLRAALPALRLTVVSWILCGLVFPLIIVGIGHVFFPYQSQGSLLRGASGQIVGSAHIGQAFTAARWFWGRPSATTDPSSGKPQPYNADNSGGSNLGPTNSALKAEVAANLQAFLQANPGVTAAQVPLDLLESSGSGLDPDITPASAYVQVPRVAAATGLPVAALNRLVQSKVRDGLLIRLFGAPHVNVLRLNLALLQLEQTPP